MGLREPLTNYRESNSAIKRLAAFVFKLTAEGSVFILLGSVFALVVYGVIIFVGINIPPNSDQLPSTMLGFAVVLSNAIAIAGWCFLDEDDYGLVN